MTSPLLRSCCAGTITP